MRTLIHKVGTVQDDTSAICRKDARAGASPQIESICHPPASGFAQFRNKLQAGTAVVCPPLLLTAQAKDSCTVEHVLRSIDASAVDELKTDVAPQKTANAKKTATQGHPYVSE